MFHCSWSSKLLEYFSFSRLADSGARDVAFREKTRRARWKCYVYTRSRGLPSTMKVRQCLLRQLSWNRTRAATIGRSKNHLALFSFKTRYDNQTEEASSRIYRLDKDDEYSTLSTLWSNIARLFKGDSERDAQLRRQIIDLEPPVFSRKRRNDTVAMSSQTSQITDYFSQQSPWVSFCPGK